MEYGGEVLVPYFVLLKSYFVNHSNDLANASALHRPDAV